jgi:DNA repair photolyase
MTKEFSTLLKIPGGGEGERCFYPVRLDPYGKGCQHNCSYCYSRALLDFRDLWDSGEPAVASMDKIRKIFSDAFDKQRQNKWTEILERKVPLRIGGMTDALQPFEETQRNSLELFKLLREYDYPYLLLTKSALVGTEEYLQAMSPELAVIQISITSLNPTTSGQIERGASKPGERLQAMRAVSKAGFYTTARISPLIPLFADGHYSNQTSEAGARRFDHFSWDLVHEVCRHGAQNVLAEMMRFNTFVHRWIGTDTGDDLRWIVNENSSKSGGWAHISINEKKYYFERIRDICKSYGVEFSVCDDGNFDEFRYLWQNQSDCCNALGKVRGFSATIRNGAPTTR